jgi:hypothetical protein
MTSDAWFSKVPASRSGPVAVAAAMALLGSVAVLAGCGGSSQPTVAVSSTATVASTTQSMTSTQPSVPELLYCVETSGVTAGSEVEALTYEAAHVAGRPIASFATACGEGTNVYSYAPDISKQATTSSEGATDGSVMAGYLPAGGGFVNLSGHEGSAYGDTAVHDADPFIDPKTEELWWIREEHQVWSAPLSGEGQARPHGRAPDYGNGSISGFNPNGEPLPLPLSMSPDGALAAAVSGSRVAVGQPHVFTAACLDRAFAAGDGEYYDFQRSPCPGITEVAYANPADCTAFVGFVSNRSFICETGAERSGFALTLLSLSFRAGRAIASPRLTLAPPMHQVLQDIEVSPDGKDVWFVGVRHPLEDNTESSLYVLPTSTPTRRPAPVTVIPEDLLTTNGQVVGWRWQGQTWPAS